MENILTKDLINKPQHSFINQLLITLPTCYIKLCSHHNPYEKVIIILKKICQECKVEQDLDGFFREIGADKRLWMKLQNSIQKYNYLVKSLQRNIEQSSKKITLQIDNFLNIKKQTISLSQGSQKQKQNYDWLALKNRQSAFENKLKSKLIQAINQSKNEKRIRQRMNEPKNQAKIHLLDESLVIDQYQKFKIDYNWSDQDEHLLRKNIGQLKKKFNSTQFLKVCNRFKFISKHEFQTLGAQQISRKIHHNNKIYLSRQFLLDKYYSSTQCLNEQQMRFILKTSPLLSKCIDKKFIKAAIKNIQYEDISKIELKIAEDIINKFDQIRKIVRSSRKIYKQDKNDEIKNKIVQFQKKKQRQIIRQIARQELKKHKINTNSHVFLKYNLSAKQIHTPFNQYHPSSALFVKDCNQQCTDDIFNNYQLRYLHKKKNNLMTPSTKKSSMVQFYTGGLEESNIIISDQALRNICFMLKAHYYEKLLMQNLQAYEIPSYNTTKRTTISTKGLSTSFDLEKRSKTIKKINEQSFQQMTIKKKILDGKQKAKGIVYINKLLSFAAENSYVNFKSLSVKLTTEQINTKDGKGNTALFYCTKHQNLQFITALLNLGADPSIVCEKGNTPLHFIFKTNNINLIVKCLCSPITPNLNALNHENKTPLAYATYAVLTKLNLQDGVLVVQNKSIDFNNNILLSKQRVDKLAEAYLWQNKIYN